MEDPEFAPLPDVRAKDIIEIGEGTIEREALERLLKGLEQPDGVISAFQNFVK